MITNGHDWVRFVVCMIVVYCPKGFKNLRCTLCRSMYWFSFQLAIIVDRYYPHFIRYAPSTRIEGMCGLSRQMFCALINFAHQTFSRFLEFIFLLF